MSSRVWEFELPRCALGMFIGKQGKNIRALQEMSVTIDLHETSLTVMGQPHQVQIVIDNVKAIVKESEMQEDQMKRQMQMQQQHLAYRSGSKKAYTNYRLQQPRLTHTTMRNPMFKRTVQRSNILKKKPVSVPKADDAFECNSDNALEGLEDHE